MATFTEFTDQVDQHLQPAYDFLSKHLRITPLVHSEWLSDVLDANVFLKLETAQPVGSFKIRGATYRIHQLTDSERAKGVICASAGNHAQGVAWGARRLGVHATVVMPETAPLVKIQNTKALGAEVILKGNSYQEAYEEASKMIQDSGQTFVHAYDDPFVVAGQGSIGFELRDQCPEAHVVIGSMGGGGMMAGLMRSYLHFKKDRSMKVIPQLWGCQAQGAAPLVESLKKHQAQIWESVSTFADGIAVAQPSARNIDILDQGHLRTFVSKDDEIAEAVVTLADRAKVIVEGSGAVVWSVALAHKRELKGKTVVLVLSGGNVDLNLLGRLLDYGLIRAGRRIRVNVSIADKPGSLNRLTQLLAQLGVNVLQVIHDRNEPSLEFDQTGVELTLETKGPEHSHEVLLQLRRETKSLYVLK